MSLQRAPARIQYQPGRLNEQKQRERYHEQREYFDEHRQDSDEWVSSGDGGRTRSHTDESYGSLLESSEKRMGTRWDAIIFYPNFSKNFSKCKYGNELGLFDHIKAQMCHSTEQNERTDGSGRKN